MNKISQYPVGGTGALYFFPNVISSIFLDSLIDQINENINRPGFRFRVNTVVFSPASIMVLGEDALAQIARDTGTSIMSSGQLWDDEYILDLLA